MSEARETPPRKPRRPAAKRPPAAVSGGGGGGDGGGKRRKVRTKQCFHCLMPCAVLHRVRVIEDGPWESVCDVCWGVRCEDNPQYVYGGLWMSGRLTQVGEQKATSQRKGNRGPRKRPSKSGSGGGKARPAGPPRPSG